MVPTDAILATTAASAYLATHCFQFSACARRFRHAALCRNMPNALLATRHSSILRYTLSSVFPLL